MRSKNTKKKKFWRDWKRFILLRSVCAQVAKLSFYFRSFSYRLAVLKITHTEKLSREFHFIMTHGCRKARQILFVIFIIFRFIKCSYRKIGKERERKRKSDFKMSTILSKGCQFLLNFPINARPMSIFSWNTIFRCATWWFRHVVGNWKWWNRDRGKYQIHYSWWICMVFYDVCTSVVRNICRRRKKKAFIRRLYRLFVIELMAITKITHSLFLFTHSCSSSSWWMV